MRTALPDEIKNDPEKHWDYNVSVRATKAITALKGIGRLYGKQYKFTKRHVDALEQMLQTALTDAIRNLREKPTRAASAPSEHRSIFNFTS